MIQKEIYINRILGGCGEGSCKQGDVTDCTWYWTKLLLL